MKRFELLLKSGKISTSVTLFDYHPANYTVGDFVDLLTQNEVFIPAHLLWADKLLILYCLENLQQS